MSAPMRDVVAVPAEPALPVAAGAMAGRPRPRRIRRFRWRWLLAALPTLVAAIYYGLVASDRYVSEAEIVVRQASDDGPKGGLASMLRLASGGVDEMSVVRAYVVSRDAIRALGTRLPLAEIFGPPGADPLARWPSVFYGPTEEQFFRYYQTVVQAIPSQEKGVLTISVQTFDPANSQAIASALVELAEGLVNRMNERMQADSVRTAEDEVKRGEDSLVASQVAVTEFRTREMILDPERNAVLLAELVGKLNTELATTQAQIEQLRRSAPSNPQIASLVTHAESVKEQIQAQRELVSLGDSALATKIAEYERLNLQGQFARRRLASAVAGLTIAKNQARRQQIFVERIVQPNLPDEATRPRRLAIVATIFGWSVLFYLIVWTVAAGMREHAAEEGSA